MSAVGSENRKEILSMQEEIKNLKCYQQKMESLLEKVIENQTEMKQNGCKYTKSISDDFRRLKKEPRRSDEQCTLFDRIQTSIPAFREVVKVGEQLIFLALP